MFYLQIWNCLVDLVCYMYVLVHVYTVQLQSCFGCICRQKCCSYTQPWHISRFILSISWSTPTDRTSCWRSRQHVTGIEKHFMWWWIAMMYRFIVPHEVVWMYFFNIQLQTSLSTAALLWPLMSHWYLSAKSHIARLGVFALSCHCNQLLAIQWC